MIAEIQVVVVSRLRGDLLRVCVSVLWLSEYVSRRPGGHLWTLAEERC
jgi:hypothetical protein